MPIFQQNPKHFHVEELLFYEPSGSGAHVFCKIRKKGMSTAAVKRALAERMGVPSSLIHHAGMKDNAATAIQWLSWPRNQQRNPPPSDLEGVEILEQSRHENALEIGHIKENRFQLYLEAVESDPLLASHAREPFPNYFGPQRFAGCEASNEFFLARLAKPRRDPQAVSAIQAWFFNEMLRERLSERGSEPGADELWMRQGGKKFFKAEWDETMRARFKEGEIAPTLPLFGYKVETTAAEDAFATRLGMDLQQYRRWGKAAKGARRLMLVAPTWNKSEAVEGEGWCLDFQLPSGSYATVLLLHLFTPELLKSSFNSWPDFTKRTDLSLGTNIMDKEHEPSL